jgi:hypothetical protein
VSKLIPIVIALILVILVIGMSTVLIMPTTPIPVSGQEGKQCRDVLIGDPDQAHRIEECCPEEHNWEYEHPGPGRYWACELSNPK